MTRVCLEVLDYVGKKHKDLFDENDEQISALIEEMNRTLTSILFGNNSPQDQTYFKEVKRHTSKSQDKW